MAHEIDADRAVTEKEETKIMAAISAVKYIGHGSVEIIIEKGVILDIVKKERERLR